MYIHVCVFVCLYVALSIYLSLIFILLLKEANFTSLHPEAGIKSPVLPIPSMISSLQFYWLHKTDLMKFSHTLYIPIINTPQGQIIYIYTYRGRSIP